MTPRLRHSTFPTHAVAVQHLLMEHTRGVVLIDAGGIVRHISPSTASALGRLTEEVVGGPAVNLVDPRHRAAFRRALQQPEEVIANTFIQLSHANRARPIDFEFTAAREGDAVRVVLTDVTSWRAVEWASQDATAMLRSLSEKRNPPAQAGGPASGPTGEHAQCFVLRLDRQCTLIAANEAWSELTGALLQPQIGAGIGPATWMRLLNRELVGEFGRALGPVAAGVPFAAHGTLLDCRGGQHPIAVALCALNAGRDGFVLVGVENGPASYASPVELAPNAGAVTPTAPRALASPAHESPVAISTVPASADLDPRTRAVIASVLSAARTDSPENQPIAEPTDTAGVTDTSPVAEVVDEGPGLFDKPVLDVAEIEVPFMTGPRLAGGAREILADQLEAMHSDGLDAVVSIALLLVEVELSAETEEDENYEMGVLERRLRSAIRDHEYADRHDDRGFVIAARGRFGHADLQALAMRIANRLQAPMRGHEATDLISLRVVAIRSRTSESDQSLITRAEDAAAHAASHELIVYVPINAA